MEYYSIVLQCNSAIVAMALHTFLKLQDKFTIWWHIREKFFPQHHHLHEIHEVSETHLHGIHVNALFHLREIHEIPMPHLHEIALLLWSRTKCVIACSQWCLPRKRPVCGNRAVGVTGDAVECGAVQ